MSWCNQSRLARPRESFVRMLVVRNSFNYYTFGESLEWRFKRRGAWASTWTKPGREDVAHWWLILTNWYYSSFAAAVELKLCEFVVCQRFMLFVWLPLILSYAINNKNKCFSFEYVIIDINCCYHCVTKYKWRMQCCNLF